MKFVFLGNMIELTTGHLLVFIALCYAQFILLQLLPRSKKSKVPPTVFHMIPWLGSAISYGMHPYYFFETNRKKYGDIFTFILFGKRMTVCLGTKGNELVFNGKVSNVNAEDVYRPITKPVFGEGVIYDVPHPVFMQQKKMVKLGLTTENFKEYVPLILSEYKKYVTSSPRLDFQKSKGRFDVYQTISELIMFASSRALQGYEARSALDTRFAGYMTDLDHGFHPLNFVLPWFPLQRNRKRDAAQKKIAKAYRAIVENRRQRGRKPDESIDMIWNLMEHHYKDGSKLTDKEISHILIGVLMGGQHTSGATLAWTILELANHPDIIDALLQEQKDVLGEDLREPEYDDLKNLKLHNFVIKETLRLHPPLHSLIRAVTRSFHTDDGQYLIPKGNYVLASPGVTARDTHTFADPNEFYPMRWENAKNIEEAEKSEKVDYGFGLVSKGTSSPYLPFGAGRHRCIGEQFAYVQLACLVCMIVRDFDFKNPPERPNLPLPSYVSMVVLPTEPSTVCWKPRRYV